MSEKLTHTTESATEHATTLKTLIRPLEYGQILIILRLDTTTGDYITDIGMNPPDIISKYVIAEFLHRQADLLSGEEPLEENEPKPSPNTWN